MEGMKNVDDGVIEYSINNNYRGLIGIYVCILIDFLYRRILFLCFDYLLEILKI